MNFKFSLRYRVALAFLILGWLISLSMGAVLYGLTIHMEEELIEETLSTELDDYINRYTLDPNTSPPSSKHIKTYVITEETLTTYPMELQQLPPGLSHITLEGKNYFAEVKQQHNTRFLILLGDEKIKFREQQYLRFLASGIGLMTLLSSLIGLWLANKVIAPVTDLAREVSIMGPDFSPLTIDKDLPQDEVGELTMAINGYHHRLAAFNERERAFTSDVSHELRTPLAIIEGASEVMLSANELAAKDKKRVERIARAASQITCLSAALLALAREESTTNNKHQCSIQKTLIQVVNDLRYLLQHKPVDVELTVENDQIIDCDPVMLHVVLANIIRNAFSYTHQGIVNIQLIEKSVVIKDTGVGMTKEQRQKMFDRYYSNNESTGGYGIGLSLVWRICKRHGWEISVHSYQEQGTSITLQLNSPS